MYTLLIADDEQLEREAIDLMVRKSGLRLRTIKVRNGREAVEAVQSSPVDIALLDIRMPGLSGLEAAKRIAEIAPECRIVFLTAWDSFDFAQEALRLGAKDYLVKPSSPQDVLALLVRLTEELDKQREAAKDDGVEKIRRILKQFNRSFFASLKYGLAPLETIRTYLSLEGIKEESGIALVFDGVAKEEHLAALLEQGLKRTMYQACYFPSVDRISVLLFSPDPETISSSFDMRGILSECTACHIGMSRPFHTHAEISRSLQEASQAYLGANHEKRALLRFDELPLIDISGISEKEIASTEKQLIEAVLDANQSEARRLAHQVQDLITLKYGQDSRSCLDHYYETVLITTRAIRSNIEHFTYESLQKSSMLELERYFMDFIDAASSVVAMDRKDKYVRLFQEVDAYMNAHYAQQLSLDQIAQHFDLSPSYFSRLFKEYIGVSYTDHLIACRMRVAKQMIRTGMKIHRVAELTGFTDYSYFSRVFRNSEGLSPRDYQRKNK